MYFVYDIIINKLLRITLEGRIQGKKGCGRPRTMFLDWLLKTEEDNISYDELKMLDKTDQDGVSEDGNLPNGAEYYGSIKRRRVVSLWDLIAACCFASDRRQLNSLRLCCMRHGVRTCGGHSCTRIDRSIRPLCRWWSFLPVFWRINSIYM